MPKLGTQIKEIALTLANVLAHAATTGNITADPAIVEKRLMLCKECRHRNGHRCTLCGCFLTTKAGLAAADCPAKKW